MSLLSNILFKTIQIQTTTKNKQKKLQSITKEVTIQGMRNNIKPWFKSNNLQSKRNFFKQSTNTFAIVNPSDSFGNEMGYLKN